MELFRDLPVANIADELNRLNCMAERMKPISKKALLGTAITVKSRIGDNLMIHKALEIAEPGDVIVVDGRGDLAHSFTGEIMMRYAMEKGLAGFVLDGAIRDVDALEQMNFSIYAAGVIPQGPYKDGPGEINVPISCGGVSVNPGDILIGDRDGIIVVNPKHAEYAARKGKAKLKQEQKTLESIQNRTWKHAEKYSDEILIKMGCDIIDEVYQ